MFGALLGSLFQGLTGGGGGGYSAPPPPPPPPPKADNSILFVGLGAAALVVLALFMRK